MTELERSMSIILHNKIELDRLTRNFSGTVRSHGLINIFENRKVTKRRDNNLKPFSAISENVTPIFKTNSYYIFS